jgi:hypothetical protein
LPAHIPHSPDQPSGERRLQHSWRRPAALPSRTVIVVAVGIRTPTQLIGAHPARHLDPAGLWHLDIQDSHIRMVLLDGSPGGFAVASFGDDLDIGGMFQELADASPHDDVVVGEQAGWSM